MSDWAGADFAISEGQRVTSNDRNESYDDPERNLHRIALAWTAAIDTKLTSDVTAADVARMMAMLKLVRDAFCPKFDNRVDLFGWGRCLERVEPTVTLEDDWHH